MGLQPNSTTLLILTPEKNAYSTTFIEAHFRYLAGTKRHLHGVYFPKYEGEKNILAKATVIGRLVEALMQKIFRRSKTYRDERALERYILTNRVDCVLAEFGPVGAEVTQVCKRLGCPLIVHFHGFDAYVTNILDKYSAAYRAMFHYAKFIVAVSRDMEQRLLDMGAPREKVVYNCYGPTNEKMSRMRLDMLNFISVGRFVDKKAPYLTILAFIDVLREYPGATLNMVGDGPLLFACKKMVESLNMGNSVKFHGVLSQADVFKLYGDSFCYVQHSIVAQNGDAEGTPVSIIEAAHAALPIVATRHMGIADVVVDGTTGFLVREGDVRGMTEKMLLLAADRERAYKMGIDGQTLIASSFSLEQHVSTLQRLIDKTIHEKPDKTGD